MGGHFNEAHYRNGSPMHSDSLANRVELVGVNSPRGYGRALRQFENRLGSPIPHSGQMVRDKSAETRGFLTAL